MKYFPARIDLSVGESFGRLPKGLFFEVVDGSYPIYSRVVLSAEIINANKAIVTLGEVIELERVDVSDGAISEEVTLHVYGDLHDKLVIEDMDFGFE